MPSIVEGGVTTVQQQTNYSVGPEGGQVTYRYIGTRDGIDAFVTSAGLAAGGVPHTVTGNDDGTASLDITYATGPGGVITSTNNPISTEYSFETPSATVPLTEHPSFVTAYAGLSADAKDEFDLLYAGEITVATLDPVAELEFDSNPDVWVVYYKKQRGVPSYYRGEPVLTVVDRYQGSAAFGIDLTVVNEVWTRSALIGWFTSPTRTINPMPTDVQGKLKVGEYLCESVSRNAASDGSRVVTQSFRWSHAWDSWIYPTRHT